MKYSQSSAVIALFLGNSSAIKLKINPSKPEGLVPPPKDLQYDVPRQLYKPLIAENENEEDDFRFRASHQDLPYSNKYLQWDIGD